MKRGLGNFLFLNDNKTESESEKIINFLFTLQDMLRARSIARASAVKIELSIGRAFLRIVLSKTAAHTVLLLSLEPSVKTLRRSGWCWRIL